MGSPPGADASWRPPPDTFKGRQLLLDLVMVVMVVAVIAWCGYVLWRLDQRSERLLAVVVAEHSLPACP